MSIPRKEDWAVKPPSLPIPRLTFIKTTKYGVMANVSLTVTGCIIKDFSGASFQ